ncbi:MAG: hypothetical protein CME38_18165 [Haliea sp.]|nr:hypothetical protein [Haliea sp.]
MMDWVAGLWPLVIVALTGWLIGVLCVLFMLIGLWRENLTPSCRARQVLFLAALPWMTMVGGLVAVHGSVLLDVGAGGGHCAAHSHIHLHACPLINNGWVAGTLELVVTLGLIAAVIGAWVRLGCREWQFHRRASGLAGLAAGGARYRVLEDDRMLAFAAGVARPVVLVSSGLLQRLSYRQCRVVMAHEAAHIRHRDGLRTLMVEVFLVVLPAWLAGRLREYWRQALEESADDVAASRFGREAVAETLIRIARASQSPVVAGFPVAGGQVVKRVRRQLFPPEERPRRPVLATLQGGLLAGVFCVAGSHHHALETLASIWLAGSL